MAARNAVNAARHQTPVSAAHLLRTELGKDCPKQGISSRSGQAGRVQPRIARKPVAGCCRHSPGVCQSDHGVYADCDSRRCLPWRSSARCMFRGEPPRRSRQSNVVCASDGQRQVKVGKGRPMPDLEHARPSTIRNAAWRTAYRLGFPLARLWWRLRRQRHEGALVAVHVGPA